MKDLKKKAFAVVGAVALAGAMVGATVADSAPAPDAVAYNELVSVPATLGVGHCISEDWQFPERYSSINAYLHDFPDAKPRDRSTFWCGVLGLPEDIPANETFPAYNNPSDPTIQVIL